MSSIPDDAERMNALDHIKFEQSPSRLCPGFDQMRPVLTCPGCNRRSPMPTYLAPFNCDCGLTMQIEGSGLFVWRSAVPA